MLDLKLTSISSRLLILLFEKDVFISFYDLSPSRLAPSPRRTVQTALSRPSNADPLAPWFHCNYTGINDGSPQIYLSTLPSGTGPEARQSLCRCSAGGWGVFLQSLPWKTKRLLCFYFSVLTEQQPAPLFSSGQGNFRNHLPQTLKCLRLVFSICLTFCICIFERLKWGGMLGPIHAAVLIPSRELPGARSPLWQKNPGPASITVAEKDVCPRFPSPMSKS